MKPMKGTVTLQANEAKISERGRFRKWAWKILLGAGLLTGASAFLYRENDEMIFKIALVFTVIEVICGLYFLLSAHKNPISEEDQSIPANRRTKRALTLLSCGLLLVLLVPLLLYMVGFLRGNSVKHYLMGKTYCKTDVDNRYETEFHSDGKCTFLHVNTGGYAEKVTYESDKGVQYSVYVSLDGKYSLIIGSSHFEIEDSFDGKYTKEDAEKIDYYKLGKSYYTLKTESVRGISLPDGIAMINSSLDCIGVEKSSAKDADYIGAAKTIIDGILQNPSSAVYNSESVYEKDDYGRVIVHLDVSVQNIFGGYVRSDYYVCIREMDSNGHFTYSTYMSYVDGEYLVDSLKSANNFGEPLYDTVKDFLIGDNPQTVSVTVGNRVLKQYIYVTGIANYVFYVDPDTGYVVSAEISVQADWLLDADEDDRKVWNSAISDLDSAFSGSIGFSDVDLVFNFDWETGALTISEEPAFVTDGYILSAAKENGVYRYSITDGRTLGYTEEEYWTPILSLGIALGIKPTSTPETIASEEALRIFNFTTKPNWNGYTFEMLTGIVFEDYKLECTAYQGSDTQFLVTLSGNYHPNAVDLPDVTRYGSMTFLVDTETGTVSPVEDSGIEDAFEVYISLNTAWYLNPGGSINWGDWDIPQESDIPSASEETAVPYLENVERADQPIFSGPGYDYIFVGTVEVAGTYTIVEEAWDDEGNLWGKLKSGVGWLDLTEVRSAEAAQAPITVGFADNTLLDSKNYYHCIVDSSEYMVQIAIRANEVLSNVNFVALSFNGEGYDVTEGLYVLSELTPDKPLVADVAFPGDMSAYGIIFAGSNGVMHYYSVTVSGRNGTLVLTEYEP